jgi:hypothetical protein
MIQGILFEKQKLPYEAWAKGDVFLSFLINLNYLNLLLYF